MAFDCIVIGLGAFGSSTLYHLAKRGLNVLGLERFEPAHDQGSSHGETRIIRQAYFEHPDYVPLLRRAYELWRDLEAESQAELMVLNGLVLSGPLEGEAVPGALRSAREHRVGVEQFNAREAATSFPMFRFPENHTIVFEAEAGYLHVERCVRVALERAQQHGAAMRFQETVRSWRVEKGEAVVTTDQGTYTARHLVLTGGAWAGQLLGAVIPALRVLRKVQLWYPRQSSDALRRAHHPCFYFECPDASIYGIPSPSQPLIKVAEHSGNVLVDDPAHVQRDLSPQDRVLIDTFVANTLVQADPVPVRHAVCMYTMSPDSHFLVDQHPELPNVHFAAGFSGHGFKFASVLGAALADLVMQGRSDLPIGFLGLQRFRQ